MNTHYFGDILHSNVMDQITFFIKKIILNISSLSLFKLNKCELRIL